MRAIVGGALVALLSFLVIASRDSTGRILLAYVTGMLLALGPFEHVVVSMLHLFFGGVGLVTMSHAAQARGAD